MKLKKKVTLGYGKGFVEKERRKEEESMSGLLDRKSKVQNTFCRETEKKEKGIDFAE